MATYTVAPGGGNINSASTYVGGVGIPGSADAIDFTTSSGQLTVNTITTIQDIDFSNYQNVITFNSVLNISRNITFGDAGGLSTYTVASNANGDFRKTGTGNLTSNGKVWTYRFTFSSGSFTVTLMDLITISGLITVSGATGNTFTLNSNNVFDPERFDALGDFTSSGTGSILTGNATIKFTGTSNQSISYSSTGQTRSSIKIDKTGGTLSLSGTINYNTGTFTYVQGTVDAGTSTLNSAVGTTFETNGIIWNNVTLAGTTAQTFTLNNNLTVSGTLSFSGTTTTTINDSNIFIIGNLSVTTTATINGTTLITFNGTGNQTWNHTVAGYLGTSVTINKTSGTLTLGANVYYRTGTLTYNNIGGIVDTTTNNSRLNSNLSTTFVTDGIIWNNATFSGSNQTFTLTNNFTLSGTLTLSGTGGTNTTINTGDINVGGLLVTTTSSIIGSSIINFTGTGTWNHTAAGYILKNININTSGTLTLGANIYYSVNTITYISGTVDSSTNSNTLNILLSNTNTWFSVNLDTAGMSWYDIALTSSGGTARTFTLTSDLSILNNFSLTNAAVGSTTTYAGDGSINCDILLLQGTNGNSHIHNFNNTNIYTNDLSTEAFTAGTQNTLNNANLYISRNIRIGNSSLLAFIAGTIQIYYVGNGTWTSRTVANQSISASFTINTSGVLTLSGNVYFAGANTFTYRNGKVNTKNSTLNITGNSTFVNCNKINFDNVVITAGNTITMNEFFSGSPNQKTTLQSSSTSNYGITFTDNFEKIAKFVNISGCTLSSPQQLLVLTDSKKNSTNRGIRYINSLPNGISKGDPSIQNILTPGQSSNLLIADPTMIKF